MAKKANTISDHVRNLHRALGLSQFLAFQAESAANRERAQIERALRSGKQRFLMKGSSIAGLDIYAKEPEFVAYSGAALQGEELINLVAEANGMTQADAVATAYEAFELYVKGITTEFLYCRRGEIPIANKQKQRLRTQYGKKAAPENTKPWFSQLVGVLAWQNCEPLFDILFEHIAGLRDRVAKFHLGDCNVAHQAVEFIRHSKTHANGRCDAARISKLPRDVQQRVSLYVRKSFLHGVPWFLPSHQNASGLIAREAEYGQILYDAITNELKMVLEWTPGRDPLTV